MKASKRAIIIFVKNPVLGKVKTRLAKDVGALTALRIYQHLVDHTRQTVLSVQSQRFLFYSEKIMDDDWRDDAFIKRVQSSGDLGTKMSEAFQEVFRTSDSVLIVGSDCPGINSNHLEEAFLLLEEKDVVFGPAKDGGYYLLGLKAWNEGLFNNIPWSSSTVLEESLEVCKRLGWRTALLEELSDVDYKEDLDHYPELKAYLN